MNRWGFLNVLLGLLLVVLVAAIFVLHTQTQKPNGYMLEGMVQSPAPGDYSVNKVFANGQTLQEPVVGSLARGSSSFEEKKTNPFQPTSDVLVRGEAIYRRDCMECHGVSGLGDGTVVKKGFPGPPSLLSQRERELPDGVLFHLVTKGGAIMPSYAAQIAPNDRWKAIAYVRRLQDRAPKEALVVNAADKSSESSSKALWPGTALMAKLDCLGCHAIDHKLVGPAFKEIAGRYHDGKHNAALVAKVKIGGSGNWGAIPMPAHEGMSEAAINTIVESILGLDPQGIPGGAK